MHVDNRAMKRRTHRGIVSRQRRGAILVAALACLLVFSLVVAGALRALATDQRQVRSRRDHLQAELLAESGIERAAAAVRAANDYTGESWRIAADELQGASDGLVVIRVENSEPAPRRRVVSVQADYPADSMHRVRVSKQVVVDL